MEKINMWERDFRVNSIIRRDKTLNIFFFPVQFRQQATSINSLRLRIR